jgi:hypothetical protein
MSLLPFSGLYLPACWCCIDFWDFGGTFMCKWYLSMIEHCIFFHSLNIFVIYTWTTTYFVRFQVFMTARMKWQPSGHSAM